MYSLGQARVTPLLTVVSASAEARSWPLTFIHQTKHGPKLYFEKLIIFYVQIVSLDFSFWFFFWVCHGVKLFTMITFVFFFFFLLFFLILFVIIFNVIIFALFSSLLRVFPRLWILNKINVWDFKFYFLW